MLQTSGNRVQLLATHDKVVTHPTTEAQRADGATVEVVRIPYATPSATRTRVLQRTVDALQPDWISLQYVPHAFNKYGLPLGLLQTLRSLRTSAARHVMFHELWITPRGPWDFKQRAIAAVEHAAVRWLIGTGFAPSVLHTHLPAYHQRLLAKGADVRPLPLFANIAAPPSPTHGASPGRFRVVFFSQLATPAEVVEFLTALAAYLAAERTELAVFLLGGNATRAAASATVLRSALPAAQVEALGFLAAEELSEHFLRADLAVTPVQHHEIGKSGTVAAFLSHRLPVAAPVVTDRGESFFLPALNRAVLDRFSAEGLADARAAARGLDTQLISVAHIAATFADHLSAARPARPVAASPTALTP